MDGYIKGCYAPKSESEINRCFTRTRNAAHTRGMLLQVSEFIRFSDKLDIHGLWLLDVNYEHFDACASDAGRRLHLSYWSLTYISKNDNMHAKRVRRYRIVSICQLHSFFIYLNHILDFNHAPGQTLSYYVF